MYKHDTNVEHKRSPDLQVIFYILRATNWWNTSKMLGSRSWVNRSVSSVVLYFSTLKMECILIMYYQM